MDPEVLNPDQVAERLRGRVISDVEVVEDEAGIRSVIVTTTYPGQTGAHALMGLSDTISFFSPVGGYDGETEIKVFGGRVAQWGDVDL